MKEQPRSLADYMRGVINMKLRAIFTKYTEDIKKYVSSKLSTSDSSAVHKSGNETIDGVKTFGSQIVGTIDKAEKDKAGNVITETYATKQDVNDSFMPLAGGILSGNIVPDTTGTRNLGTESAKFKEVWADEVHISQNTLYVGDVPVIGSSEDTIVVKADPDQSIQMKTSGEGLSQITSESGVTISSTGINSNISVSAKGANASVAIASDKAINITSANVNIDADTTIKNLTVTGTTTTVNTEDLKVKDNVVELNSGETGNGVSKGTAGIKVNRGDALPYLIQFDESDDLFKVGEQGDLEIIASRPYVDDAVSPKANDSNVVHKSGNETIAGTKTFSETRTKFFKSLDLYHNEDYKLNKNPSAKAYQYVFFTGKSGWHSAFLENQVDTDGASYCNLSTRNTNEQSASVQLAIDSNGVKTFKPATNNDISLGASTSKWKAVYANTFNGNLVGNSNTATQFSSNAAVTLTGDVTGTASSKKGWSVAATVKNITKAATFDITAEEIAAIIV